MGWHTKPRSEGRRSEDDEEGWQEDDESFEADLASKPWLAEAWKDAWRASPTSKPRAGRLLAEATECPHEASEL